jgi:hypothetical protein
MGDELNLMMMIQSDKLTTMYTCISDYCDVHMMSNSRCYTIAMGDRPTFHAICMHASC